MERNQSPVTKVCVQKNIDNSQKSPGIPKVAAQQRQSDSARRAVRDSPNNFRRNPDSRRESPRYAEPVRRGSRDPSGKINRRDSDNFEERNRKIESKAKRLLNCSFANAGENFYSTCPTRPVFRKREQDVKGEDLRKVKDESTELEAENEKEN